MSKQKQQVTTLADTLLKESTSPAPIEPRVSRRERERVAAKEFHRKFIEDNGGFPVEVGEARGVTYLLPSGARVIADSFGNPKYYPAPQESRSRLYYQIAYLRKRIELFDYAVGTMTNIVEAERLIELYEQDRSDTRVISLPLFTWDIKLYGPPPMEDNADSNESTKVDGSQVRSASSSRALGLLKLRRRTLARKLEKLMQEPGATDFMPNGIFTLRINAIEQRTS